MTQLSASQSVGYADPLTPDAPRTHYGLTRAAWVKVGVIAALLAGLFWPNLRRLWLKTNPVSGEPNWQHSVFVPLIGLYYLYLNREALLKPWTVKAWPGRAKAWGAWLMMLGAVAGTLFYAWAYFRWKVPILGNPTFHAGVVGVFGAATLIVLLATTAGARNRKKADRSAFARLAESSATWFGFYAMLWGLAFFAWSIYPGQNDFFKDCAIVVVLFGAVLMTCGWRVMHTAWFPIVFLLCAIPWPGLVYSWVAMPLQKLAATGATWVLQLTGEEAARFGTKMFVGFDPVTGNWKRNLNVADACAGLKSLMTFVCVGAAVGFLSSRAMWQRIIITASSVPIAVLCNVIRVSAQVLLDRLDPRWTEGFAHTFVGLVMLIPAFFMILFVAWLLDHIFVEEVDKKAVVAKAAPAVIEVPRAASGIPAARPTMGIAPKAKPAAPAPPPKPAPAAAPVAAPAAKPAAAPAAPGRSMAARPARRPAAPNPSTPAAAAPKPAVPAVKPSNEEGKQ